jgi:hypothetical protein
MNPVLASCNTAFASALRNNGCYTLTAANSGMCLGAFSVSS